VVVLFDRVGFWGARDCWVAEFGEIDDNIESEMCPIVHNLKGKEDNKVPELNIANFGGHNSSILKSDQEEGYLEKKHLTISKNPIKELNSGPEHKHNQREHKKVNSFGITHNPIKGRQRKQPDYNLNHDHKNKHKFEFVLLVEGHRAEVADEDLKVGERGQPEEVVDDGDGNCAEGEEKCAHFPWVDCEGQGQDE
jgi:hypothetical protein